MAGFKIVQVLATIATFAPSLSSAQDNTSYVDYNIEPQPSLYEQTVDTPLLSGFPDCLSGPLTNTTACDTSASYYERAQALISLFTLEELIANTQNNAPGVPRLGLPNYQVWNEALHGLDKANLTDAGDFSWATSFPQPILSMAALNRTLVHQIGSIISTQARAFNNDGRYGLDSYAPNINGFRAPIWGRGQETPGEDATFLSSAYAYEYITGLQGGVDPEHLKIIATAKHFAGYDIESWNNHSRLGNDVSISQQDLSDYYTPQFLAAVRYAKTHSVMCSYNAVNGVPSCANSFFLQTLLRDSWDFPDQGYVSSDCDAVYNVFNPHLYANNVSVASADSMLAGTDIDCGQNYPLYLNESVISGEISRNVIEKSVVRLYTTLMRAGYFDHSTSVYGNLSWSDVQATDAWNISYEAAVEGIVLLKNDGTLPLSSTVKSIALVGPWANATSQMQGNYFGAAPYLISPLAAFEAAGLQVNFALGTNISGTSTQGFSDALTAAKDSDAIVYLGGIDNTVEAEGMDRETLTWPGNQLDLVSQLSQVGKPMVVLQMGGGQVDTSSIKNNTAIGSLLWGGYPGQSGGAAIVDILTGKRAPAGRLTTTQYPASYAEQFDFLDMGLRPNGSNPGQTYIWYTGEPVYQFGEGIFYTTFDATSAAGSNASNSFDLNTLVSASHPGYAYLEQAPFMNFSATVKNAGTVASPYTFMVFANTTNAGPAPYPNKWLAGFDRLATITPGASSTFDVPIPLGALARADESGDKVLYPGDYELALNNERSVVMEFKFTGGPVVLEKWPLEEQQVLPSA
ncbi:putative exo-1,4-beta-xylosidase xlnD [Lachnellula suecica]|uniref:xylan 1,4-beta-xylosidase n=1 Tax=Lachnellula suecica TaxID=602035 RepID=A0A8T9CA57_9HELO|nr:putative exo-1,4-beta-xylosidase xlnD [Lachnellula suecica]